MTSPLSASAPEPTTRISEAKRVIEESAMIWRAAVTLEGHGYFSQAEELRALARELPLRFARSAARGGSHV